MNLFRDLVTSILLLTVLSACGGGGGGGDTPTDTSFVFSLFPPGYFDGSYSDSYSLTGSFSSGDNVAATFSAQSGSAKIFNAQSVMTIDQQVFITNIATSVVTTSSSEIYYSTDKNNLVLVGGLSITGGTSYMATSTSIIPLTGSIGDFGDIGSYTESDGTSFTITWVLQDGFNGKAKLVETSVTRDSSNVLDTTEIDTYTISQDGTISRFDFTVIFHQRGSLTITMSGS